MDDGGGGGANVELSVVRLNVCTVLHVKPEKNLGGARGYKGGGGECPPAPPLSATLIRYRPSFTQHVAAVTRGAWNRNAKATALPRWRASLKWADNSSRIYSRDRRKTGGSS